MATSGLFSVEIRAALAKSLDKTVTEITDSGVPGYHFRVDSQDWIIEVVRGNYFPPEMAEQLEVRAKRVSPESVAAIFIPEGEEFDAVMTVAVAGGLPVILKLGADYDLALTTPPAVGAPPAVRPTRIPPDLAGSVAGLTALSAPFREVLERFSSQHAELRKADPAEEGAEEREGDLLRDTFRDLVGSDTRFIGEHDALDILRQLEAQWRLTGRAKRDHYFHSFQNFLLGCVAIEALYDSFGGWLQEAFPPSGVAVEYVWLLTSLFHDVGYAIQKGPDVDAVLFGMDVRVDPDSGASSDALPEYELQRRSDYWNTLDYRWHRRQLVDIFGHLTAPVIESDWTPNVILGREVPESPFDDAMEASFMSPKSHGAASALLLLRAISKKPAANLEATARALVQKSMYVAAVSIPIHDWYFRKFLSERGVGSISSKRFPIAVLLTFIDSIQDDRREFGSAFAPDVLEGLDVEADGTLTARIAMDRIPPEKLAGKQLEAKGVVDYVDQDGLMFRYPADFA